MSLCDWCHEEHDADELALFVFNGQDEKVCERCLLNDEHRFGLPAPEDRDDD